MVHPHIGSARITYPTGVQVSPVDPMTSAALPPALRAIPGVVSRPIRLGVPVLRMRSPSRVGDLGYYSTLGQASVDAAGNLVMAPAGFFASLPTWVWWVGAGGLLVLLLGGGLFGARARRAPRVRTVTRTTY